MSNKLYDRLKFMTQIVLPALGALYFTLAQIWGMPHGEQVVGSITATVLFLGICLGISSSKYSPEPVEGTPVGDFIVEQGSEGQTIYRLALSGDPETFSEKDVISFKVNRGEN